MARHVTASPHVELMRLRPGDREGRLVAVERWNISAARGLVHLRRGLVEDANYDWSVRAGDHPSADVFDHRLPSAAWAWGIAFAESPRAVEAGDATILVVAPADAGRSEPGWASVVGTAGRVRLGRIDRGLSRWIEGFLATRASDENR